MCLQNWTFKCKHIFKVVHVLQKSIKAQSSKDLCVLRAMIHLLLQLVSWEHRSYLLEHINSWSQRLTPKPIFLCVCFLYFVNCCFLFVLIFAFSLVKGILGCYDCGHRILEWFRLEKTLKVIYFQPWCRGHGCHVYYHVVCHVDYHLVKLWTALIAGSLLSARLSILNVATIDSILLILKVT